MSRLASIVSRETVLIALTLAGLNKLQVKVSEIENAYISSPCTENLDGPRGQIWPRCWEDSNHGPGTLRFKKCQCIFLQPPC
jgi:hypothetical protein